MKKILILSLVTSSMLMSQTTYIPTISDIERQIQVPKETEKKQTPLIEINGVKKYAPVMKDDKSGKTIFVKSFQIQNAINIDESVLQDLIREYTNKDLTFQDLQTVASIITKEYRKQGYFVARAYVPVQNVKENNGMIIIAIIEGNYGEFILENNSLVKDSIVQGMLDEAKKNNSVVSTSTLERSMLIINDTSGVVVSQADIMPGKEIGTSDFQIVTKPSKRVNGYVVADNTGSKYTGKNRAMAGVSVNSPFKIGDKLSLSGLVSNGADLKNGSLSYQAPLHPNGLKGEISYAKTDYSLTNVGLIEALGASKTLDVKLSYPIIRTRNENLYASLKIANKDLENEQDTDITKKNTKSLTLYLDYDKSYTAFAKPTNSSVNFALTYGDLSFDDKEDKEADELGDNTNGNYSKVNLDLNNTIFLTNQISLESSLKMQYALGNKNLDGSEDISIGGSTGVKLYPDGELSAENGYVLNIETKYQLPNYNNLNSSVGIFYDRGRAFMIDSSNNITFEAKSLQDVGIGYYASYKDFFSKVQVAWKIDNKDITSEDDRNSRILFQGGLSF